MNVLFLLNAALYYQQYTEIGYLSYPTSHLNDLLHVIRDPHFSFFVPVDARDTVFDSGVMSRVLNYLQHEGNNIIYLYGEFDIWTSCAVALTGQTNAISVTVEGKGHQFDLADCQADDRERILNALEDWLQREIERQIER